MKNMKKFLALLLAFVLTVSPVGTVYATDNEPDVQESGIVDPLSEEDNSSIELSCSPEVPESGWYTTESPEISVAFYNATLWSFKYSLNSGEPISLNDYLVGNVDFSIMEANIGAGTLGDGAYVFYADASSDDITPLDQVKLEFGVDSTGVDYSNVSTEGLAILNGVGYAKSSYSITGFEDATSGIKSITTISENMYGIGYTKDEPVIITSDIIYLRLEDVAGNVSEVPVKDIIGCSEVIFDETEPVIVIEKDKGSSYEKDGLSYYNNSLSINVIVSDDNLNEVVVYINDTLAGSSVISDREVTIPYEFDASGSYKIDVVVKDKSNNEVSKTENFIIDLDAPEKGSLSLVGDWVEIDGNLYTKGTVSIEGIPSDALSGYKNLEILKDDSVVGTFTPYTIVESGAYSIKVYDNVGNYSVFSITDIADVSTNSIIVDNTNPVVSIDMDASTTPIYNGERGIWYTSYPEFSVSANDEYIKSVTVTLTVDGVDFNIYSSDSGLDNAIISTDGHEGFEYIFNVYAEDIKGNIGTTQIEYFVDNDVPHDIAASTSTSYIEKGGCVFIAEDLVVQLSAIDDGFGELAYTLTDSNNSVTTSSGLFVISSSGEYTVAAKDRLGNTSGEFTLSELLGWSSNRVVFVTTVPEISATGYNDSWNKSHVNYLVTASDENGINSYSVEINGTVVHSETFDEVDKNDCIIEFSTADCGEEATEYSVKVTVVNNAGKSSVWEDAVKVDRVPPEVGSISAIGNWVEVDDCVFSNERIEISGDAIDSLSGVGTVEVYKNSQLVSSSLPYYITSSGSYELKITDNVGNITTVSISELMHTTSNSIVIDEEVPDVSFDAESTTPTTAYDGINWFNHYPSIIFNASDNNKIHVNVTVNVDGIDYDEYSGSSTGDFQYTINTGRYAGTSYVITVTAVDNSGNDYTITYSFCVDTSKPTVGSMVITSNYSDYAFGSYTGDSFVFSGSAEDVGSGIDTITVIREGTVCYESNNGVLDFVLDEVDESGFYSVVVEDRVGNTTTFNAKELLGSQSNVLVFDNTLPSIVRTDSEVPTKSTWYNYVPALSFNVADVNLKSYSVVVNEDIVKYGSDPEAFTLDLRRYVNMPVTVTITAEDYTGNTNTYSFSYSNDMSAPTNVQASVSADYVEKGSNVYFTGSFVITFTAEDAGYGDITYIFNGEENASGMFVISEDGEYSVVVKDDLGNATANIKVSDLMGWRSNKIVVDTRKPTISATKLNGRWVAQSPVYSIEIGDDYGIDKVVVTVNGTKLIDEEFTEASLTSKSLTVNTAEAVCNSNGSYNITVSVTDNSGLTTTWSDVSYLDTTAPVITDFVVSGATNSIGNTINGSDVYGFFFDGNGSIEVKYDDLGASSGVSTVYTRLEGYEWVEHDVTSGSISVNVPKNFNGKLEAYAVDSVGNIGTANCPDLLISETRENHNSSADVVITLPNNEYSDINGLPLYNEDITANFTANFGISGIQSAQWWLDSVENPVSDLNGTAFDKNLITAINQNLDIYGNKNSMVVSVNVTDMVGHSTKVSKFFSIDKDKPVISVSYDTSTTNGYYNVTRTATVSVNERNFNPNLFVIDGVYGDVGSWQETSQGVWETTITFSDNNEYQFTLNCTDRAGNVASQYVSEKFVVDKTHPVITRVDENVESAAGWFDYAPEFSFEVAEQYIEKYEVYINGSVVYTGSTNEFTADTSNYTNMPVSIRVYVEDKAGNGANWYYSYQHDDKGPVDIAVSSDSPVTQKAGTVYYNSPFVISVSANDGIGYGDLTYYLNDEFNKSGEFTITSDGEYFVKVVDGLGHESETVSLGEYLGWYGNNIVINNTAPVITWGKHNGEWLDSPCVDSIKASANVGIDSIIVTVNGIVVVNNSYDDLTTFEDTVIVDTSRAELGADSSYKYVITVTDNSGIISTSEDIVYVDLNSPEMGSMTVDGNWEIHGDFLYTKEVITLKGYPADDESGVKSVEVIKDGTVVGTLPYNITGSGEYKVRVTDNVGNQVVYSFAEIANVSTSSIVWDNTFPYVYFDMEKSDAYQYVNGDTYWYANNPLIYIGMSDTNMESVSVKVTIDDNTTVVVDDIIENGIYAIDTSYANGTQFSIIATARDKSGNVSTASYEFKVDTSKPSNGSLKVTATPEYAEVGGYVYTRGQFSITGLPDDIGSGVKRITVYKDGTVFANFANEALNILVNKESLSGSYFIEVEDNVGNIYRVNANEPLGTTSNNFIADLTNPTITRTDTNVETKSGWFNYAPVFTYNISDTYISKYTVYVNNELYKTGNASETVNVDTKKYENQPVEIRIDVADKAGNTAQYVYNYKHDNTCPGNLGIEITDPVSFKGGNVYYNGSVPFKISASDPAYGDISYYVNGLRVENGEYTISKSGVYSFEVVDGLGNSTGVISLKDFLNWTGNNVVLDTENPSISSNEFNGSWIKGIGYYTIDVSDNLGIDNISVVINGKSVDTFNTDQVSVTKHSIKVDTTMVDASSDGSFNVVVTVVDNSGLSATWEDTVYVDNVFPVVDKFNVSGDVNRLSTEDAYGYFFNGSGFIKIVCSDGNPSSGLKSIWTRFEGYDWVEHKVSESGEITVEVPKDFKGTFEAYAVDNVGNVGTVKSPAKLISETSENHSKNQSISITLPDTPYSDSNGLPLYNSDITANLMIGCNWSGLKKLTWGIEGKVDVTNFTSGVYEENIVTKYDQRIQLTGNSNSMVVTVDVTDMSSLVSSGAAKFSIDKDAPIISVAFGSSVDNSYYKNTRVATITVIERNFDPNRFVIGGNSGTLGSWSNNGNVWTNTITFSEDGDYQFTLDCTDRAGNKASQYVSEKFTIDKTMPVMSVNWNNNSSENEIYFKEGRTATITVIEHNFDSSLFSITGNGSLSAWSSNGDTHTATVSFLTDGEYEFTLNGYDLANNAITEVYNSGKFIIDLTNPVIEIDRVTEGVSYKGNVEFVVTVSDVYINSNTKVYLSGKTHDEVEITGKFVGQSGIFSYTDFSEEQDVDDIYTIRVVAVDNAGNTTEDSITFSVNRFGSSYSFYNAEYLNNYLNESKDVSITEVNVDKLDTSKVVVTITKDGKEIDVKSSWLKITEKEVDGRFLYTYFISKEAFTEDGKYSVVIFSVAEEGTKYTSASEQYDFIVDTTSPTIIISGIETGKDYREYERLVAVDIRDLSGIVDVKFFVNDTEITDYKESEGIYRFIVGESDEAQKVTVSVTDMAGNVSTVSVENFLITSNLMVYLINQLWFIILIAVILFIIVLMIIMLLMNRRKDKDEEQEALVASGELYRSTASGSSSSGTTGDTTGNEHQILSGDAPTVDQGASVDASETTMLNENTDSVPTTMMEEPTDVMDDNSESETGLMDK